MPRVTRLIRPNLKARPRPIADRATGVYVYDADGKDYIDATGGAYTVSIGHGVPEVLKAIDEQLHKIAFVGPHLECAPAEELAELVVELAQPGFSHAWFASSGSEAVDAAMKLARQFHRDCGRHTRTRFIALEESYHGVTIGALSATGLSAMRLAGGWDALCLPVQHIPPPSCGEPRGCPYGLTYPGCDLLCATALKTAITAAGESTIAAFLVEPIPSTGVPPEGYFSKIREICDEHDVLMIADEVKTGFGRTGKPFCMEHFDIVPDITIFGKSVAGGYVPLSGMLVQHEVVQTIKNATGLFLHNHTFSGHALCCAAGLAVQKYAIKNNLYDHVASMGALLRTRLESLVDRYEAARAVSGMGLLQYLYMDAPVSVKDKWQVFGHLAEEGLLVWAVVQKDSMHVDFCPPFVVSESDIDEIFSRLDAGLSKWGYEVLG